MKKLDRTDKKILTLLQKKGRISLSELSEQVNLSITPCSERVKRLEKEGFILGYHAKLNPQLLERSLLVFIEIELASKSKAIFDSVATNITSIPYVLECHLVSGEFDYLIKARLKQMSAYRELLNDILQKLPPLASSKSYIAMEEIKESFDLTLDD